MKKIIFVFAVIVFIMAVNTSTVNADGTIDWAGNGSKNLPCANGGHWVLSPSFGIEAPVTLTVDGSDYPMEQSGNGSWSADSEGAIDASVVASVSFTGIGDDQNHLQLSHCNDETPTNTFTPTHTLTPTSTMINTPTPTEPSKITKTPKPTDPTETKVVKTPQSTPPGGGGDGAPATNFPIGVVFLFTGLGILVFLGRKYLMKI